MGHVALLITATVLAAVAAHRFAGGPGYPSRAYVLPDTMREDRPRPWWQLGLQLSSTFGRRWLRTRLRRRPRGPRNATALPADARPDGSLLLPGLRDAEHARAAGRAAALAAASAVGTVGLQAGDAWAVPPLAAVAAVLVGLLTVRPGVAHPTAAAIMLLPLSGAASGVAAGVAAAVAIAGTLRRRQAAWVRLGLVLAVALVAEAAWRLAG